MSRSSGQHVDERTEHKECDGCGWAGETEVWYDPEISMTGWDCPGCGGATFEPIEREQCSDY